jgi:hypothetical protein
MFTIGQAIAEQRARGVPNPEKLVAERLGIAKLTPEMYGLDMSVLTPVLQFQNALSAPAKQEQVPDALRQQTTQWQWPPPQPPNPRDPDTIKSDALRLAQNMQKYGTTPYTPMGVAARGANFVANVVPSMAASGAGMAYGAVKELGMPFARAVSGYTPSADEVTPFDRERLNYKSTIDQRDNMNMIDSASSSLVDMTMGIGAIAANNMGLSPTGAEGKDFIPHFIENARARFERGQQFGEAAVVGPFAMAKQVYDEPGKTISNDWPALLLQAAAAGKMVSALRKRGVTPGSQPVQEFVPESALTKQPVGPDGFPTGPQFRLTPFDAVQAAAEAEVEAAKGETGITKSRGTRAADAALKTGRSVMTPLQNAAIAAQTLGGEAVGAGARFGFGYGFGDALGSPMLGTALGATAAAAPYASALMGKLNPAYAQAAILAKQRLVDPLAARTPAETELLHSVSIEPKAMRSGVALAMKSGLNEFATSGEKPLGIANDAPAPKYNLQQLKYDPSAQSFVQNPEGGGVYGDLATQSMESNVADIGNTGAARIYGEKASRVGSSLTREEGLYGDKPVRPFEDIKADLDSVAAELQEVRDTASLAGTVEGKKKYVGRLEGSVEAGLQKRDELAAQKIEIDNSKAQAAQERSNKTQADLSQALKDMERQRDNATVAMQEAVAADPNASGPGVQGKKLTEQQQAYRKAKKLLDQADARIPAIRESQQRTAASAKANIDYHQDIAEQAVVRAESRRQQRLADIDSKLADTSAKIDAVSEEIRTLEEQLPPGLNAAKFKQWLNGLYDERRALWKEEKSYVITEDGLVKKADVLRGQLEQLTQKRDELRQRVKDNAKARNEGKIVTSSDSMNKAAGTVKEVDRTYVYGGMPLEFMDEKGVVRPITRFEEITGERAAAAVNYLHETMNRNLPIGAEPIPRWYAQQLFMEALFNDSPMLAGSKRLRGAVAKRIAREAGLPNDKGLQEAINKELDNVASTALSLGGEQGQKPTWSNLTIGDKSFDLRTIVAETSISMGKDAGIKIAIAKEAAERVANAMGHKMEAANHARAIRNEATRSYPPTVTEPYGKAMWMFGKEDPGVRPQLFTDFNTAPVVSQIRADPVGFFNAAKENVPGFVDRSGGDAAGAALAFADELARIKPTDKSVNTVLASASAEGMIPATDQIHAHETILDPTNANSAAILAAASMDSVTELTRKLGNALKGAQTYGRIATQLGNIVSNVVVESMMRGVLPEQVVYEYVGAMRKWNAWVKGEKPSNEKDASVKVANLNITGDDIMRGIAETGVTDSHAITDLIKNFGKGDSSKGVLRSAAGNAVQMAKTLYVMGDTVPKIANIMRGVHKTVQAVSKLEEGTTLTLDIGRKSVVVVENRSGVLVDASSGVPLTQQQLVKAVARASFRTASQYLFDFNDLPLVPKIAGANPLLGSVMPYLSWKWKATDLPGIKPGIGHAIMSYDPSFLAQTTSPAVQRGRVADLGKLFLTRAALLGGARSQTDYGDAIGTAIAHSDRHYAPAAITYASENDFEDSMMPLNSAFAFGPTIETMRAGLAAFAAVAGPSWEKRLDPTGEQLNAMTPADKEKLKRARRWWTDREAGRIGTLSDVLAWVGLTGSFIGQINEYAQREQRANRPLDLAPMLGVVTMTAAGGTANDIGKVVASLGSEHSPFSGWRLGVQDGMPTQPIGTAYGPEDWTRYAVRTIMGFGIQSNSGGLMQIDNVTKFGRVLTTNLVNARMKQLGLNLQKNLPPGTDPLAAARISKSVEEASKAFDDTMGQLLSREGQGDEPPDMNEAVSNANASLQQTITSGVANSGVKLSEEGARQLQEDLERIVRGARIAGMEIAERTIYVASRLKGAPAGTGPGTRDSRKMVDGKMKTVRESQRDYLNRVTLERRARQRGESK